MLIRYWTGFHHNIIDKDVFGSRQMKQNLFQCPLKRRYRLAAVCKGQRIRVFVIGYVPPVAYPRVGLLIPKIRTLLTYFRIALSLTSTYR